MIIKQLFIVGLVFITGTRPGTINSIFSDYRLFDFENDYSDETDTDDEKGRKNEII